MIVIRYPDIVTPIDVYLAIVHDVSVNVKPPEYVVRRLNVDDRVEIEIAQIPVEEVAISNPPGAGGSPRHVLCVGPDTQAAAAGRTRGIIPFGAVADEGSKRAENRLVDVDGGRRGLDKSTIEHPEVRAVDADWVKNVVDECNVTEDVVQVVPSEENLGSPGRCR